MILTHPLHIYEYSMSKYLGLTYTNFKGYFYQKGLIFGQNIFLQRFYLTICRSNDIFSYQKRLTILFEKKIENSHDFLPPRGNKSSAGTFPPWPGNTQYSYSILTYEAEKIWVSTQILTHRPQWVWVATHDTYSWPFEVEYLRNTYMSTYSWVLCHE